MFNTVILTGRLTADPELKTTNSGVYVCSFTIANDTGFGDNKKTNFINIVTWKGTAEFVSKYFTKGMLIGIEGYIQSRKWQDKEGNSRTSVEVVARNVQFVERKNDNQSEQQQYSYVQNDGMQEVTITTDDDLPF